MCTMQSCGLAPPHATIYKRIIGTLKLTTNSHKDIHLYARLYGTIGYLLSFAAVYTKYGVILDT